MIRQAQDPRYADCLNNLRKGETTIQDYALLRTRIKSKSEIDEEIKQNNTITLLPLRRDVYRMNENRLILSPEQEFTCWQDIRIFYDASSLVGKEKKAKKWQECDNAEGKTERKR